MFDMGYPPQVVDLLVNLYRKQTAKVRIAGTTSTRFRVLKGVRQGCVVHCVILEENLEKSRHCYYTKYGSYKH